MDDDLCRLVYYSRNHANTSAAELDKTISEILATSRRNNGSAYVTGALMFNSGCFAQVLEGPRSALEQTFERIQQDDRHSDVTILTFEPVEARTFGDWSMGFVGRSVTNAHRYGHIAAASGFDPAQVGGAGVFDIMRRLALEEENAG